MVSIVRYIRRVYRTGGEIITLTRHCVECAISADDKISYSWFCLTLSVITLKLPDHEAPQPPICHQQRMTTRNSRRGSSTCFFSFSSSSTPQHTVSPSPPLCVFQYLLFFDRDWLLGSIKFIFNAKYWIDFRSPVSWQSDDSSNVFVLEDPRQRGKSRRMRKLWLWGGGDEKTENHKHWHSRYWTISSKIFT